MYIVVMIITGVEKKRFFTAEGSAFRFHAMGHGFEKEYYPNKANAEIYAKRYLKYQHLGKFTEQQIIM